MPVDRIPDKSRSVARMKTASGYEKVQDPRDEVLRRFSKNFRKMVENRENLAPEKPSVSRQGRTVKFDPEIVETSIGGTQSLARINRLSDTSLSSYSSSSTATGNSSVLSNNSSSSDSCTFNGSLSHSYIDTSSIISAGDTPIKTKSRSFASASRTKRSSSKEFVTPSKLLNKRLTGEVSTPECFNQVSFETPRPKSAQKRKSSVEPGASEDSSSVTVAVRVRPFSTR